MEVNSKFILIVDDNPNNLSVMAKTLTHAGYQFRVAIDGETAIRQVLEDPPDLILLDVHMPGIDGFEVCAQLKANPSALDIPIIFMTALADTANKVKGLTIGAVDYITKPFQAEEVLARVKVHLQLRALTQSLAERTAELETANQALQQLATLDGLTQIANRRLFDERLAHEWKRLARDQKPLSLILCDVDYFKRYNDRYGHLAGDVCLKKVAQAVNQTVRRPADLAARYGGEELAVILPDTDTWGAVQVAKNIQLAIQNLQLVHSMSDVSDYVTLSLGIASIAPGHDITPALLIVRADEALYKAKHQGRNAFSISPPLIESLFHKMD